MAAENGQGRKKKFEVRRKRKADKWKRGRLHARGKTKEAKNNKKTQKIEPNGNKRVHNLWRLSY